MTSEVKKSITLSGQQEMATMRVNGRASFDRSVQQGGRRRPSGARCCASADDRFGDEAIQPVQALLLQFGRLSVAEIPRATEQVLNFAEAQNIDLRSAALLTAKAIGSSTNALVRYGVEIDNSLRGTERYEAVLEQLESRVGGTAEAMGNTFLGSIEKLSNAWGDLLEKVGDFITQNQGFRKIIDLIIDQVARWGDKMEKLAGSHEAQAEGSQPHQGCPRRDPGRDGRSDHRFGLMAKVLLPVMKLFASLSGRPSRSRRKAGSSPFRSPIRRRLSRRRPRIMKLLPGAVRQVFDEAKLWTMEYERVHAALQQSRKDFQEAEGAIESMIDKGIKEARFGLSALRNTIANVSLETEKQTDEVLPASREAWRSWLDDLRDFIEDPELLDQIPVFAEDMGRSFGGSFIDGAMGEFDKWSDVLEEFGQRAERILLQAFMEPIIGVNSAFQELAQVVVTPFMAIGQRLNQWIFEPLVDGFLRFIGVKRAIEEADKKAAIAGHIQAGRVCRRDQPSRRLCHAAGTHRRCDRCRDRHPRNRAQLWPAGGGYGGWSYRSGPGTRQGRQHPLRPCCSRRAHQATDIRPRWRGGRRVLHQPAPPGEGRRPAEPDVHAVPGPCELGGGQGRRVSLPWKRWRQH